MSQQITSGKLMNEKLMNEKLMNETVAGAYISSIMFLIKWSGALMVKN